MKIPASTEPFLYGAAAGAIALAIIGFNFGGWVTGATAKERASARVDLATVELLAPICVAQFQKGPEAKARLATLMGTDRWDQSDYVSKGGWATMPGSSAEPNRDVAEACAKTLAKRDV
jgi:alpha/beta superfamily hydrolase